MLDNGHPKDVDISKALTENYEGVEMEETYRRTLLASMLNTASPRRRQTPAARWLFGAAAAAVILLAYLGVTHFAGTGAGNDRLFAVTQVFSTATDSKGHRLKVGDYVAAGETVSTGGGGRITLVAKNGSLIHLDERTEVRLDARGSATIGKGRLYCANRMHEIKTIETPAGSIRLLGTVLDASVINEEIAAVTVVEGKVQLANSHGEKIVSAGSQAKMVTSHAPEGGCKVDTAAETAWYDGRDSIISDTDEIAYTIKRSKGVPREERHAVTELWAMKSDGSGKRLVAALVGSLIQLGGWWPGSQWALLEGQGAVNMVDPERPLQAKKLRIVNVATGQNEYLPLPPDFDMDSASVSPDGKQVAIDGVYQSNIFNKPGSTASRRAEGGIWIYDTQSRKITLLLSDKERSWVGPVTWSPDGRWLAVSERKGNYTPWQVHLVDTRTGETRQIARGSQPVFSPDGTKLAYREPIDASKSPGARPVYVIDTSGRGRALQLSPDGASHVLPTWSPDGSKVAFVTKEHNRSYIIRVAKSDGSGTQDVHTVKRADNIAWGRDGRTIFIRTGEGMITVAADGSGLIADLGGNETDSVPPPDVREQLAQARSAVAQAQRDIYAVGYIRVYQGRLDEARSILQEAASSISSVPWAYPLARVSVSDVTSEADAAYDSASAPSSDLLSMACWYRISVTDLGLGVYSRGQAKLPPDIQTLERSGRFGISTKDSHDSRVAGLTCPGKDRPHPVHFTYTPPKNGVPKIGDVIFQCPNHPEHRVVWGRFLDTIRNKPALKPAVKK